MGDGCNPPSSESPSTPPPKNSSPSPKPRFKLRPFPIGAIISTFLGVVLIALLKVGVKSCTFAVVDATAGRKPIKTHVVPEPLPEVKAAEITPDTDPDPDVRRFKIGTRQRKGELAIKIPDGWEMQPRGVNPAEVFTLIKSTNSGHQAQIILTVVDTTVGMPDVWVMDREDCLRRVRAKNPTVKILGFEKLVLSNQHAIVSTSDYVEEGESFRLKNYLLWWDSLMITLTLRTVGPRRAELQGFFDDEFVETASSFRIVDRATSNSKR